MKIAVVSDDGETISRHFGRAQFYVVIEVDDGEAVARETRPKVGHSTFANHGHESHGPQNPRGTGHGSQAKHQAMAETISDCEVLIAGRMGQGAFDSLEELGIEPVLTDVREITEAVTLFARGDLPNRIDLLH